jgi:hypothetical protein
LDPLIPLGIGGADDVRNLWPEPQAKWTAETKDCLEWKLREMICAGELDVREAQHMIAEDWMAA